MPIKSAIDLPLDNYLASRPTPAKPSGDHIPLGGFVLERAQMANYRIVTIDKAGKLGQHRGFVCNNDDDAIVWAKQLVDDAPVELWSGARFVARLEPPVSTNPDRRAEGPPSGGRVLPFPN